MSGQTISAAKSALQQAVQMLTIHDYFTIGAFDHEMRWFQCPINSAPYLFHADPGTIALACQWIESIEASGGTNILLPYDIATTLLLNPRTQTSISPSQISGPYKVDLYHPFINSLSYIPLQKFTLI